MVPTPMQEVIQALTYRGANASITDVQGNTPAMLADIHGHSDVATYLRHLEESSST